MTITLNNRIETLVGYDQISVSELLVLRNFSYKLLVVQVNDKPIKKEDFEQTLIRAGDKVAVLHLMAGG